MSGFSGIHLYNQELQEKLAAFLFPEDLNGFFHKRSEFSDPSTRLAHYSNKKFTGLKGLFTCSGLKVGLDGVFPGNWENGEKIGAYLIEACTNAPAGAVRPDRLAALRGSFSGCVLTEQDITLFADPTGSHPVFYYHSKSFLAFSNSIFLLRDMVRHFGVSISFDHDAARMMASLGYLLEDYTLIREIRKITAGKMIRFTADALRETRYHSYFQPVEHTRITPDFLSELDVRFRRSVNTEFDLDRKHGYSHLSTLSKQAVQNRSVNATARLYTEIIGNNLF